MSCTKRSNIASLSPLNPTSPGAYVLTLTPHTLHTFCKIVPDHNYGCNLSKLRNPIKNVRFLKEPYIFLYVFLVFLNFVPDFDQEELAVEGRDCAEWCACPQAFSHYLIVCFTRTVSLAIRRCPASLAGGGTTRPAR